MRLFLALWPNDEVISRLAAQALTWDWSQGARFTAPDRLHLTLHFLGDVDSAALASLREAVAVPWAGCGLVLDRPQVWPGGTAVLEATQVPAALQRLHAALGERLHRLGLPVEARRFRPHVTLARNAAGSRPGFAALPIVWQAGPSYALMRSLAGGRGYETVQVFG